MSHINNGSLLNFGVIMIVCLPILSTSMAKTQGIVGYILQKKKEKKRKTDKQTEWKKEKKQAITKEQIKENSSLNLQNQMQVLKKSGRIKNPLCSTSEGSYSWCAMRQVEWHKRLLIGIWGTTQFYTRPSYWFRMTVWHTNLFPVPCTKLYMQHCFPIKKKNLTIVTDSD